MTQKVLTEDLAHWGSSVGRQFLFLQPRKERTLQGHSSTTLVRDPPYVRARSVGLGIQNGKTEGGMTVPWSPRWRSRQLQTRARLEAGLTVPTANRKD